MKALGYISAALLLLFPIRAFSQSGDRDTKYDMPSLTMLYLNHPEKMFNDELQKVYTSLPFPARYFDHSLGVTSVTFFGNDKGNVYALSKFAEREQIAKKMVSKWFSRDPETGAFDVELIKQRGCYNSDMLERSLSDKQIAGMRILEDSGERLINHTFLLVNEFDYETVESIIKKSDVEAAPLSMEDYFSDIKNSGINLLSRLKIKCTSYLFRLNWNDVAQGMFYNIYYFPKNTSDKKVKERYENDREVFTLSFMGQCTSDYSEKNNSFKNNRQFVEVSCARALEKNLAVLGRRFEGFRVKAALISTDPLMADLGMKEGVGTNNLFEVLERVEDEDGIIKYVRKGIIRPITDKIADNRYNVNGEISNTGMKYTEFERVSGGDFYPGMLIREISSYHSK